MTELAVDIENVGGIEEASFSFEDPVSIISGPNATNKTSILQAISFAVGRDALSIRSDATEASVTLSIGDETVTRTARRSGLGISISGEPWISDPDDRALFEYFGCLLELNPLRSAVLQTEAVEQVLKEPINVDAMERERSMKMDEKRRLQRELEGTEGITEELRTQQQAIEELREDEVRLEDRLTSLREQRSEATDADGGLEELREQRADLVHALDTHESQLAALEDAIDQLADEREDVAATLEETQERADEYDLEALKTERASLQEEMDDITRRLDILQSALTANREVLNSEFTGILGRESTLMDEHVTCWVCGQSATVSGINESVDQLQTLIEVDEERKREYEPRLEQIEDQMAEANEARRRVGTIETALDDIEADIESRRESLETKRGAAADLRDELEELDLRIQEHESEQMSDITELMDELEGIRVELQAARRDIKRGEERLETLEERERERVEKAQRVEEVTAEINELTDLIENLENHLREEFNEAMDELVSRLRFNRIERIWLDGGLDVVIAREVDGSVREDSLDSLAESEREVVGLVLALAGYATYDLEETAPVLVMDTLGALDAERARNLIDYFSERTEFLIAAMLPQNAEALDHTTVRLNEQTRFV